MCDEGVADDGAAAEHEVEHAVRQPRVGQRGGEVGGGERDDLSRLPHDRVAERNRGRDLPGGDCDRKVPRSDRQDDPERLAPRVEERQRRVARVRLAVGLEGLTGVVAEDRRSAARFADRLGERLPLLAREVTADRVGALVDEVGRASKDVAARRRRRFAPGREGCCGRVAG